MSTTIHACVFNSLHRARAKASAVIFFIDPIAMAMAAYDREIQHFSLWFQTLSSGQRRAFLDKLVSVATPHKLFAQVERVLACAQRIPTTWEECQDVEEQALFCRARVQSWSAARANSFLNALEEIDQTAVYEFYDKIARTVNEP